MRTTLKDKPHPEKEEDEVFVGNVSINTPLNRVMGWKTARRGVKAFDEFGIPIRRSTLTPVFVKRNEVVGFGVRVVMTSYCGFKPKGHDYQLIKAMMAKVK